MKLCRFNANRLGVVEADTVLDVTSALDFLPKAGYPLPRHDLLIANLEAVKKRVEDLMPGANRLPLNAVQIVSPVANPGKIMAAPVN